MSGLRLRTLVALLSLMIASTILALTLGLWENSNKLLNDLLDVVGRYTWAIQPQSEEGTMPEPLPFEGQAYEALKQLPGVLEVGVETGISKSMDSFGYSTNYINQDFFAVRRYSLAQGRFANDTTEAVVGANLAHLMNTSVSLDDGFEENSVLVTGVLASVSDRDPEDDNALYLSLETASIFAYPNTMYVEVEPQNFAETKTRLEGWLDDQGLAGYQVTRLADRYGIALREKVAQLLGGALIYGVVATLLVAGINLVSLFLSQILGRIRQLGIRRAFGATEQAVISEEISATLPWVALGLVGSLPLIYLGSLWLKNITGLSAAPGILSIIALVLSLVFLVTLSALLPSAWAAKQTPAYAIRGLASTLLVSRVWLASLGLGLGVASLILQASMSNAAVIETKKVLGELNPRVATLGSFDSEQGVFADPRAMVSMQSADVQAFLDSPLAEKFSRSSYIRAFPRSEIKGSKSTSFSTVMVYSGDYPELMGIELIEGNLPNPEATELLLGQDVAKTLFADEAVGQELMLFGRQWKISGVFSAGTMGIAGSASDQKVLMPGKGVRAKGEFNIMALEVAPGHDIDQTLAEAEAFFTSRYPPETTVPFRAVQPKDAIPPDISQTLKSLSGVYQILALALLFLGGSGLASQLLVTLSARISEIGVRRAVGASQQDIFGQFLVESMRLGLIATLAGVVAGVLFSYITARLQSITFSPSLLWMILSVIVGMSITLVFGAAPGYLAAKLQPTAALRNRQI